MLPAGYWPTRFSVSFLGASRRLGGRKLVSVPHSEPCARMQRRDGHGADGIPPGLGFRPFRPRIVVGIGYFFARNVAVAGLVPRGESVPAEESGIGAGCGGIPGGKREGITESRKKP